jgi:tRNA (guanine-N7-)-methyltransferase
MPRSRPAIDVSSYLIDASEPPNHVPFEWSALFGNHNPVELEIGSGKGLFLINAAIANPSRNFLGIELSRKYARLAAERVARRALSNVKLYRGDAGLVMARLVAASSLRAVHVYFPDPWWKKRHKKRRVFTDALVSELERTLEHGGELRVASDVEEYFTLIQGLIAAHPRFALLPLHDTAEPASAPEDLTNFERKYRLEGRPIYRARYVLKKGT